MVPTGNKPLSKYFSFMACRISLKTLSLDLQGPGPPIAIKHGSLKGHDMSLLKTGLAEQVVDNNFP